MSSSRCGGLRSNRAPIGCRRCRWPARLVEVGSASIVGAAPRAEGSHWTERAQALLAPLMHAAALDGATMRTLLTWVDRRQALPAQQILAGEPGRATELARNLLDGIVATDERELSGIWSTASGSLTGFRSDQALDATEHPDFDADRFVISSDTIYIAAPAHRQRLVAPMVVGLIDDIRHATYARKAGPGVPAPPPVVLALDELANIAPVPDLPSMISEGGGQGLVTLACLQDLSQARHRWPDHADGFPSLFGTTVVLPGIGDVRTLEALSALAGDEEITDPHHLHRSIVDRPPVRRPADRAAVPRAARAFRPSGGGVFLSMSSPGAPPVMPWPSMSATGRVGSPLPRPTHPSPGGASRDLDRTRSHRIGLEPAGPGASMD